MKPTLPQHDPDPSARAARLAKTAERYAWHIDEHGILVIDALPKDEDYDLPYALDGAGAAFELLRNRANQKSVNWPSLRSELSLDGASSPSEYIKRATKRLWETREYLPRQRPTSIDGYSDLITTLPKPLSMGLHDDDLFFAWRQVAGMTPILLQRITRVPDHLGLDARAFTRGAGADDSLDAALAEGRLFVVDYACLAGLEAGTTEGLNKHVYAPIAVFVAQGGALRPVGIQLNQHPDPAHPLWTPGDGIAWRMAKAVVNSAEMAFNGVVAHFGLCHLAAEALICVTRQRLADTHPLTLLLAPHFHYTLATNQTARTSIVNPGGKQEYLMGGTLESNFTVTRAALAAVQYDRIGARADAAARGVDDREVLPAHPYRDDGEPVADAIHRYTAAYVRAHYEDDASVGADPELRAWREALSRDAGFAAVPALDTRDAVARFVGDLIWRLTGYHAVVNYGGHDYASWAVDMPSALFAAGPEAGASEARWQEMLPPVVVANGMLEQMYSLRAIHRNALGDETAPHARDARVREAIARFREELAVIERESEARDKTRPWSFPYLRPSRISNSIHV